MGLFSKKETKNIETCHTCSVCYTPPPLQEVAFVHMCSRCADAARKEREKDRILLLWAKRYEEQIYPAAKEEFDTFTPYLKSRTITIRTVKAPKDRR